MSRAGEAMSQAIQRACMQAFVGIVSNVDWETMSCTVEFAHAPGLKARGNIWTISGTGGTLIPPIEDGDLALLVVTGPDLTELLRDRAAKRVSNPFLYDRSDVLVLPGVFARNGEAATRTPQTAPAPGGWLLCASDGSELRFDPATSEWIFKLGAEGKMYLGGKTGAKAVARDGDAAGVASVSASQSRVYVGEP